MLGSGEEGYAESQGAVKTVSVGMQKIVKDCWKAVGIENHG